MPSTYRHPMSESMTPSTHIANWSPKRPKKETLMKYTPKTYDHLIGHLKGLSEKQLTNHFELYKGYVKKISEIEEKLQSADRSQGNYSFSEISELQRRRAVAFNGMKLHELYFENLNGKSSYPSKELEAALAKSFGSMDRWREDTLSGLKTSNGWVLLCCCQEDGSLTNVVVEEHHKGLLAGYDIILAIDGWEHAYMIDYGIKEDEYFKAIEPHLDWNIASQRLAALRADLRDARLSA